MRLTSLVAVSIVVCLAAASLGAAGTLSVTTRDSVGEPLLCRVVARTAAGTPLFPDSTEICYPHHGPIPYFISDGAFTLGAEGPVTLTFSRGPEYHSDVRVADVTGNASLEVTLQRFVNMPAAGWHSGDTHAHLWHDEPNPLDPVDGVRLARAEGLEFVSILDADRYFTGAPDSASTSDCLLYSSMEYRSHVYGHMALPGLQTLVTPYASAAPGDPAYPVNADMIAVAKNHMGIVLYAHPASHSDFWDTSEWPMTGIARELPADAALGLVDGLEVLSYSNILPFAALPLWYDLLNAGIRLAATAGTDVVLNRPASNPIGGYRVYVNTGEPTFDMNAWFEALRHGRTFVTAGPLVTDLRVGQAGIGDTLRLPAGPTTLQGTVSLASDTPLQQLEVLWNGAVAFSAGLPYSSTATVGFSIPVSQSGWLAVKATSVPRTDVQVVNQPLAHTSPIWVELCGQPVRPRADAVRRLVDWNEDLRALVRQRGGFEQSEDSLRVETLLTNGTAALASAFSSPPSPPVTVKPAQGETVRHLRPSLAWHMPADPDPGDIFDYRVRIVSAPELLESALPAATDDSSYVPRDPLEHGHVYWWNVEARDAARNSVTSAAGWFAVDTTGAASVPDPSPAARWSAEPVPFAGSIEIRCSFQGPARLEIFDVRGRRIQVLEGEAPFIWNGRDAMGREVSSGLYLVVPRTGPALRVVKLR